MGSIVNECEKKMALSFSAAINWLFFVDELSDQVVSP